MAGKSPKSRTTEDPEQPLPIVNVFVEDDERSEAPVKPPTSRQRVVVEVEEDDASAQSKEPAAAKIETEVEPLMSEESETMPEPDLPPPSLPVSKPVATADAENVRPQLQVPSGETPNIRIADTEDPVLPAFFSETTQPVDDAKEQPEPEVPVTAPVPEENELEAVPESQQPQSTFQSAAEQVMPQAFVGELHAINKDVKSEKKGIVILVIVIILFFVILGGGTAYWYMNNRGKSDVVVMVQPTASPLPVATMAPTPVATQSAVLAASPSATKVNVLNGTSVSGLAAKEAAVLKKAGYTIGKVGNGLPASAGTITVPKGQKATGQAVASALSGYTFTVTESTASTEVTVTLGQPQ